MPIFGEETTHQTFVLDLPQMMYDSQLTILSDSLLKSPALSSKYLNMLACHRRQRIRR